ncbi:hypothetical protein XENOCAPTIV_016884 [Xenoophorus captivus]|uniref:Uncharacterized protein n=1 Tax=Xenoophorus captivus TaxID=1517983 RepID=A0ABV0RZB7_9TELE
MVLNFNFAAIRKICKTETRQRRQQEGPKAAVKPAGLSITCACLLRPAAYTSTPPSGEKFPSVPYFARYPNDDKCATRH